MPGPQPVPAAWERAAYYESHLHHMLPGHRKVEGRLTQEKQKPAFPKWELRHLTGGLRCDEDAGRLAKFVNLGL